MLRARFAVKRLFLPSAVAALYGKTHPEFASYLYLVAPISLVFLNPIGFILMEVSAVLVG